MTVQNPNGFINLLVTGAGGYVGSLLVPALLERGYRVKAVDLYWYGRDIFGDHATNSRLEMVDLDIRDTASLASHFQGVDAVLHLACISNDPSFEMNPALGKSINADCFPRLLQGAIDGGVKRFIYASSSSIYGVKAEPNVTEETPPEPLTDYSKFKLACERILLDHPRPCGMERVIVRPATVCGYAPRLRLDLVVNILTINALVKRTIRVFGGSQLRPNIVIRDMVRAYQTLLDADRAQVDGEAFNAGYQNYPVIELARLIRNALDDPEIEIQVEPTDDLRSYHVNSDKIRERLGFVAQHTIEEAVRELASVFRADRLHDPLNNPLYYNMKTMQRLQVK